MNKVEIIKLMVEAKKLGLKKEYMELKAMKENEDFESYKDTDYTLTVREAIPEMSAILFGRVNLPGVPYGKYDEEFDMIEKAYLSILRKELA